MDKKIARRVAAEIKASAWKCGFDGPGGNVTFAQASLAYRRAGGDTCFLERLEDHWRDTPIKKISARAIR
ncbi:MAG: hypothetical protein AAGG56_19015 [Pseudomonadota bacterium]